MNSPLVTSSANDFAMIAGAIPAAQDGPGLVGLFLEAGPVAQLVFAILAFFSIGSWAIMFSKRQQFRAVEKHNEAFLKAFRQSARFSEINAVASQHKQSPLVGLFQAGYLEIDAQVKAQGNSGAGEGYRVKSLTGIERSLQRAIGVEMAQLGQHASFLATTASATPFIGLFGTVLGIMGAFNDIAATGSASILAVAPGIAEALINTAAGLVAAIPALIGYNQLGNRLRSAKQSLEDFALEFLNLAERNFT